MLPVVTPSFVLVPEREQVKHSQSKIMTKSTSIILVIIMIMTFLIIAVYVLKLSVPYPSIIIITEINSQHPPTNITPSFVISAAPVTPCLVFSAAATTPSLALDKPFINVSMAA